MYTNSRLLYNCRDQIVCIALLYKTKAVEKLQESKLQASLNRKTQNKQNTSTHTEVETCCEEIRSAKHTICQMITFFNIAKESWLGKSGHYIDTFCSPNLAWPSRLFTH